MCNHPGSFRGLKLRLFMVALMAPLKGRSSTLIGTLVHVECSFLQVNMFYGIDFLPEKKLSEAAEFFS